MADPDTLPVIRLPMATGSLTGPGTDPAQDAGKNIGFPVQFIGPAIPFLVNAPDIPGNIGFGRTSLLAWHTFVHLPEIPDII